MAMEFLAGQFDVFKTWNQSIETLTEALQKWMPRFLANSFLALNYVFSVQVWYICLNLIDLSKKKTFCFFKTDIKAKKLFARNLGIHF